MGADVEMKDEGKDAKKEGEKEEEIVKVLDVLDVVRDPPSPGNATALVDSACPSRPHGFPGVPHDATRDAEPPPRDPDPSQLFENVTLLEKSVASKGEPRFVAKVLRQVRVPPDAPSGANGPLFRSQISPPTGTRSALRSLPAR